MAPTAESLGRVTLAHSRGPMRRLSSVRRDALSRLAAGQVWQGASQELQVGPERPVRAIDVVEHDHVGEGDAGGAEHLPRTRHARAQVIPPAVPAFELGILLRYNRARAYQAHLSLQDVHELRQLVERVSPQEAADPCYARVVGDLEQGRGLVQLEELLLEGIGPHP